eukprot:Hpha_TRINITY_DN2589_c0_g1::TRINITY_DN2589_c0_g1_i1::g.1372::m.1372
MVKRAACVSKTQVVKAQLQRSQQKKLEKAFKRDEQKKAQKKIKNEAKKRQAKEEAAKQAAAAAQGRDDDLAEVPYGSVVEARGLKNLKELNGLIGISGKEKREGPGRVMVLVNFPPPHGEKMLRRSNVSVCPEGTPAPSVVIKHPEEGEAKKSGLLA